jgi:hypothetical protein
MWSVYKCNRMLKYNMMNWVYYLFNYPFNTSYITWILRRAVTTELRSVWKETVVVISLRGRGRPFLITDSNLTPPNTSEERYHCPSPVGFVTSWSKVGRRSTFVRSAMQIHHLCSQREIALLWTRLHVLSILEYIMYALFDPVLNDLHSFRLVFLPPPRAPASPTYSVVNYVQ